MDWAKRSPCILHLPGPRSCFMGGMRIGGQQTLDDIRARTCHERLQWYRADFSSLAQVRALAEQLAREQERMDVLVNNAGITMVL